MRRSVSSPVLKDDVGELVVEGAARPAPACVATPTMISAHVQQFVALKAESATRRIEVQRQHTKVGKGAINRAEAQGVSERAVESR